MTADLHLLMVGAGKGSFQMRAVQLGEALGARVTSAPTDRDWQWATLAVLVKRAGAAYAGQARSAGVPIVWDAVDFWRQPAENTSDEAHARALLRSHLTALRPALVIGATAAMAEAAGGTWVPHHSWAGLTPAPARDQVQAVAYEGNPLYLGEWAIRVRAACQARGWTFLVNPPDLRAADLIVTLRDGQWDGWICREWKSNVKVTNAIAAGRPVIGQASAAVRECTPPGSVIETAADLTEAFDAWTPVAPRAAAVVQCQALAPAFTLAAVVTQYRAVLAAVQETTCAA